MNDNDTVVLALTRDDLSELILMCEMERNAADAQAKVCLESVSFQYTRLAHRANELILKLEEAYKRLPK